MTILRDISAIWSLVHVLVLFILLYEPRFSKKTTIIWTSIVGTVWLVLHGWLFIAFGPETFTQLVLITGTIPSFIFFWIMSKQRDGRFVFTFCLCDTVSAEILLVTNLLDYWVFGGQYISMFIIRLIAFPVIEFLAYKYLRSTFKSVQRSVKNGWWSFACVTAIFYILIIALSSVPEDMTRDASRLPAFILLIVLMPLMYWNIFQVLYRQQKIFELAEKDNILNLQVANMQQRIDQLVEADKKFVIERHDMRHTFRTMTEMLQNNQIEELREYLCSIENRFDTTNTKRYCTNTILNAVLSSYIRIADEKGIEVVTELAVPNEFRVDIVELSTVFANAIENAINACEKLPGEKRRIEMRALSHPQFMFQITNPYEGEVIMGDDGVPASAQDGHGFGTRSIVAFCEKNNAFYEFKADGNIFTLRIVI